MRPADTVAGVDDFASDLEALGFRRVGTRRADEWVKQATPYLTYSVHLDEAGALFTWEVAIGELMSDHGLQVGSNETLNQFLFPKHDARGPADIDFVVSEIARAEDLLRAIDLTGGRPG